jgi:hypothetical protein
MAAEPTKQGDGNTTIEIYDIVDMIYNNTLKGNRREAERRLRDEDNSEFRRLIHCGKIVARPEDFPEIPAEDWHRGTITLWRWNHGLEVGMDVCIDPENFARVYHIDSVSEIELEDESDMPRHATRIEVSEVQINGSYAVIPGEDSIDITRDVMRMRLAALKHI